MLMDVNKALADKFPKEAFSVFYTHTSQVLVVDLTEGKRLTPQPLTDHNAPPTPPKRTGQCKTLHETLSTQNDIMVTTVEASRRDAEDKTFIVFDIPLKSIASVGQRLRLQASGITPIGYRWTELDKRPLEANPRLSPSTDARQYFYKGAMVVFNDNQYFDCGQATNNTAIMISIILHPDELADDFEGPYSL